MVHDQIVRARIIRHGVGGVLDLDSVQVLELTLQDGDTLELIRKGDLNSPFRPAPWSYHYGIEKVHGPAADLICGVQYTNGAVRHFELPLT